ncbi:YolD-like family protein [Cytobacillus spongiae]|jgi:hypothetical protein|uniref:YolD-like family protein n=1 Tax=Cytobacillus spongiae TaxID=2901381 RepID=UPI001F3D899F|nr:YolD-like family protein [Cytobacillus spongiae]UII54736.1 YolD-like family protein [Cytobacillus spongiae]
MIRDRGRMKWTAMMLPEHVKLLRNWALEDTYEQKKHVDEQHLEQMNDIISEAMEFGTTVTMIYYQKRQHQLLMGKIHYWDELAQKLHMMDRFDEVHHIRIDEIVDVQLTEG